MSSINRTDEPSTLETQLYDMHEQYEDGLTRDAEEFVIGLLTLLPEPSVRVVKPEERSGRTATANATSTEESKEERTLKRALISVFVSQALEYLRHVDVQGAHGLREIARDLNQPEKLQMCAFLLSASVVYSLVCNYCSLCTCTVDGATQAPLTNITLFSSLLWINLERHARFSLSLSLSLSG